MATIKNLTSQELLGKVKLSSELASLDLRIELRQKLIDNNLTSKDALRDHGVVKTYLLLGHNDYSTIQSKLFFRSRISRVRSNLNDWPSAGTLKSAKDWDSSLTKGLEVPDWYPLGYGSVKVMIQELQHLGVIDMDRLCALKDDEAINVISKVVIRTQAYLSSRPPQEQFVDYLRDAVIRYEEKKRRHQPWVDQFEAITQEEEDNPF